MWDWTPLRRLCLLTTKNTKTQGLAEHLENDTWIIHQQVLLEINCRNIHISEIFGFCAHSYTDPYCCPIGFKDQLVRVIGKDKTESTVQLEASYRYLRLLRWPSCKYTELLKELADLNHLNLHLPIRTPNLSSLMTRWPLQKGGGNCFQFISPPQQRSPAYPLRPKFLHLYL